MSTGAGIAIAGIWLAVSLVGWHEPAAGLLMASPATFTTLVIAAWGR